jgi:saccharopine dehydrogenase-like NADP-dependent oxidoreductase
MRTVLVGLGAVGARCARQLLSSGATSQLLVLSRHPERAAARAAALGSTEMVSLERLTAQAFADAAGPADVAILASPAGTGDLAAAELAAAALASGTSVVSTGDDPAEARSLLGLNDRATAAGATVAIGVCMAPGLSCLMAAWAAGRMDQASEVHIATLGTGGPSCARRRHVALSEPVDEWQDGAWTRRVASSGRELVWFPGQLGADCYRVNRPDALLLTGALPGLRWVTSRAAASRRDRFTSRLPMLRPPHPEGTVGGLVVEVRGWRAGEAHSVLVGASGRPALIAGAVAATAAVRAANHQLKTGAGGLAALAPAPAGFLGELVERGVSLLTFRGAQTTPAW